MAKYYVPEFHYDNGKKPKLNSLIEQLYVKAYNRYCELSNPLIEEWNRMFDADHPDLEEDRWDPRSKYMTFFREKEDQVIRSMEPNLGYMTSWFFKTFYIGEELEFRGVLYDGTEMHFTLREES